jgi:hypothetical protein
MFEMPSPWVETGLGAHGALSASRRARATEPGCGAEPHVGEDIE